MPTAVITGGSAGLGQALAHGLARRGWDLTIDGRRQPELTAAAVALDSAGAGSVTALPGDVADPEHRQRLAAVVAGRPLDLLVNNASTLGPTPLPPLLELDPDALRTVFAVNLFGPLALCQLLWPALRAGRGCLINISSDAAVEHYPGWGGYGASKAALDHFTATLAAESAEEPVVRSYAVDPGDMRTAMHQAAFAGEDISDRPLPESVVPALLALIGQRPPSGRYRASEIAGRTEPATSARPEPALKQH